MPFYVVRLKEHNPARGCFLKDYSGPSCRKYVAGEAEAGKPFKPSTMYKTTDETEVEKLRTVRQPNRPDVAAFDVFVANDEDELNEFIQREMEQRVNDGLPAVRSPVIQLPPKPPRNQPEFLGEPQTDAQAVSENEPIPVEKLLAGEDVGLGKKKELAKAPVTSMGDGKKLEELVPTTKPGGQKAEPEGGDEGEEAKAKKGRSLKGASKSKSGKLCAYPRCKKNRYPQGEGFCGAHKKQLDAGEIESAGYYRGTDE
jgi:hypothetical protein